MASSKKKRDEVALAILLKLVEKHPAVVGERRVISEVVQQIVTGAFAYADQFIIQSEE